MGLSQETRQSRVGGKDNTLPQPGRDSGCQTVYLQRQSVLDLCLRPVLWVVLRVQNKSDVRGRVSSVGPSDLEALPRGGRPCAGRCLSSSPPSPLSCTSFSFGVSPQLAQVSSGCSPSLLCSCLGKVASRGEDTTSGDSYTNRGGGRERDCRLARAQQQKGCTPLGRRASWGFE